MATKHKQCPVYNKLVTILRCPDVLTSAHEIDTRDWDDWKSVGTVYGAFHTGGSRVYTVASQKHGSIDAVFECPWSMLTREIDHTFAIRRDSFGKPTYWHVMAGINVDEMDKTMHLICRTRNPNGVA